MRVYTCLIVGNLLLQLKFDFWNDWILLTGQNLFFLFTLQSQYEHHKEVLAAQGVKIIGKDLEKALAGLPLYVAHDDDEVEYYKVSLP